MFQSAAALAFAGGEVPAVAPYPSVLLPSLTAVAAVATALIVAFPARAHVVADVPTKRLTP